VKRMPRGERGSPAVRHAGLRSARASARARASTTPGAEDERDLTRARWGTARRHLDSAYNSGWVRGVKCSRTQEQHRPVGLRRTGVVPACQSAPGRTWSPPASLPGGAHVLNVPVIAPQCRAKREHPLGVSRSLGGGREGPSPICIQNATITSQEPL
jgi:hypothetical protein